MKQLLLLLAIYLPGTIICRAQQGYAAQPGSYMYGIVVYDEGKSIYITNILNIGNYQGCEGAFGKAEASDCASKSMWTALQNEEGDLYRKYRGGIKTYLNTHSGYGSHQYFLSIDEAQKELDKSIDYYTTRGYQVGKLRLK